ncbi:MAG: SpoIVB peptidase [Clostridiales bacterium]|nr:SpoIVB peptidase [Clostridiales bacterium]
MKRIIRTADCIIAVILIFIYALIGFGSYALPNEVGSYNFQTITFDSIYTIKSEENSQVDYQSNLRVSEIESEIKLFGIIPVKSANILQQEEKSVYVSGECFGIKLYSDGVMVVGTKDVDTADGETNPAKQAGIEVGDLIIEINGVKMLSSSQVEETLNDNNGTDFTFKIKRNGNYKTLILSPAYSVSEKCYKAGIWVRDSTAGIGTITFYNPENQTMATLGHPITDVDTNEIVPILNGEAVRATVTKVYKSTSGETGSLCCDFSDETIGTLSVNTDYGIYGEYNIEIENSLLYQVASEQEVERGEAQILCTVDSGTPKLYDVEITRISYREGNHDKNMVIKVTDEELLSKTGGIIQGMSGSPIIQNGKLVGALTHVIVDDPEKGYAIFANKMVNQSENV